MKHFLLLLPLSLLIACGPPADVKYCQGYGEVEGTPEFAKCIDYFHTQNNWFNNDRAVCNEIADLTYPQSLYDHGGREHARVYGGYGHHHDGFGSRHVYIEREPDYQRNAMLDDLRHMIVQPCMTDKGWKSARSWELGRTDKR